MNAPQEPVVPILVALPVVVRDHPQHGIQIHTQTRRVINKDYDPLYDGTQETCGESLKKDLRESVFDATVRGCREEMGLPDLEVQIIGKEGRIFSTQPGKDEILSFEPLCLVQQLKGAQHWFGPGFIVLVPPDTEPQQDAEGETSGHRWWKPSDLMDELKKTPQSFMGLHYPVLLKVCEYFLTNRIVSIDDD